MQYLLLGRTSRGQAFGRALGTVFWLGAYAYLGGGGWIRRFFFSSSCLLVREVGDMENWPSNVDEGEKSCRSPPPPPPNPGYAYVWGCWQATKQKTKGPELTSKKQTKTVCLLQVGVVLGCYSSADKQKKRSSLQNYCLFGHFYRLGCSFSGGAAAPSAPLAPRGLQSLRATPLVQSIHAMKFEYITKMKLADYQSSQRSSFGNPSLKRNFLQSLRISRFDMSISISPISPKNYSLNLYYDKIIPSMCHIHNLNVSYFVSVLFLSFTQLPTG